MRFETYASAAFIALMLMGSAGFLGHQAYNDIGLFAPLQETDK